MNIRYRVELSQVERDEITTRVSKGKCAARKLKRAQILLAADAKRGDLPLLHLHVHHPCHFSNTQSRSELLAVSTEFRPTRSVLIDPPSDAD